MSRILLKESEIRRYVRSLIREAMEMEGHASPKTIQKWINATPEEIASWRPVGTQDPTEFAALQRMALRQPYDRTHLAQASRDIEDAWRRHNGLKSFKTWIDPETGKKLRKINSVDAEGNPVFGSKTAEEKHEAHKETAKMHKRGVDFKKKIQKQGEQEALRKEQERLEREQSVAQEQALMTQWCQENNIDPSSPEAKQLYSKHILQEMDKFYHERGMDEFSLDALNRRIAWLKARMKATDMSTDDWDKKVYDSCAYVLKDAERIKRENFDNDGRRLRKVNNTVDTTLSDEEIDAMSQEGKETAAQDMYGKDSDFMLWCKQYDCEPNEQTKSVFDSYVAQYNEWCKKYYRDPNDPSSKEVFDEFFSEETQNELKNVKNSSLQTPQTDTPNNSVNDEDDDFNSMNDGYDDDGLSGRLARSNRGQWDRIYDDEDDYSNDNDDGYDYNEWN